MEDLISDTEALRCLLTQVKLCDPTTCVWNIIPSLQLCRFKVLPCNYTAISDPNPSLLTMQAYFLPVQIIMQIIILDKQSVINCGLAVSAFVSFLHFPFCALNRAQFKDFLSLSFSYAVVTNSKWMPLYLNQVFISEILINTLISNLFIHSLVDVRLVCFNLLDPVNGSAVSICV